MYENSKALSVRKGGRDGLAKPVQPVHDFAAFKIAQLPARQKTTPRTEYFARAVAELLECESCYAAALLPNAIGGPEEVLIGRATSDPSCADGVARIARGGGCADGALIKPINAPTAFVRKLIGPEPDGKCHAVMGRLSAGNGVTIVFVAGWRKRALASSETPFFARAVRAMWKTARAIADMQLFDRKAWLEKLIFPAIVVDEGLVVHESNLRGRALLAKGELLKVDRGRLCGLNPSVTDRMTKAFFETLTSPGLMNATVPLSTDRQQFAFARIVGVPGDADKVLVIVPQFDEVSGARRIASVFGLTWAEERIIARILHGHSPRQIGTELRLTEATVRTYTKRIMLKMGINRRTEFFLLYSLTLSPFGVASGSGQSWLIRP